MRSPAIADLVHLTNTPSDNFFAETLLKDLGARYGSGGTTAAGAAVVRRTIAATFHLQPRLDDGSGLSRYDRSSPADVVSLLRQQQTNPAFTSSLAVAGETGTLKRELRGTAAQGRCRGKTGTLTDASNVVGYCRAQDGHTLAYAFMMNSIDPLRRAPDPERDGAGARPLRRLRLAVGSAALPASTARSPASSSTRTPSRSAEASFDPAASPATR